jgi:hypothetical protein
MEETVGPVSTCGRELLRGWWRPIDFMVNFVIFTASVRSILDTLSYYFSPHFIILGVHEIRAVLRCYQGYTGNSLQPIGFNVKGQEIRVFYYYMYILACSSAAHVVGFLVVVSTHSWQRNKMELNYFVLSALTFTSLCFCVFVVCCVTVLYLCICANWVELGRTKHVFRNKFLFLIPLILQAN